MEPVMRSLRAKLFPALLCAITASLLAQNSGAQLRDRSTIARVTINDEKNWQDEFYRYVRWEDEDYGPTAFEGVARRRGIGTIEIFDPNDEAKRCIGALAHAMPATAFAVDASGKQIAIEPVDEDVNAACRHPDTRVTPRPDLAARQFYVSGSREGLAIEGSPATSPNAFISELKSRRAKAIVLRDASIGDMLCFGAIARAARVRILQVKSDGELEQLNIQGGNVETACAFGR
jgi:hypothetical protein